MKIEIYRDAGDSDRYMGPDNIKHQERVNNEVHDERYMGEDERDDSSGRPETDRKKTETIRQTRFEKARQKRKNSQKTSPVLAETMQP